jgi:organic hydroperoxide reductase OsmC/OhrA
MEAKALVVRIPNSYSPRAAACFLNAIRYAAGRLSIAIPADLKGTERVDIECNDTGGNARFASAAGA